jgi:hypothetical protein
MKADDDDRRCQLTDVTDVGARGDQAEAPTRLDERRGLSRSSSASATESGRPHAHVRSVRLFTSQPRQTSLPACGKRAELEKKMCENRKKKMSGCRASPHFGCMSLDHCGTIRGVPIPLPTSPSLTHASINQSTTSAKPTDE